MAQRQRRKKRRRGEEEKGRRGEGVKGRRGEGERGRRERRGQSVDGPLLALICNRCHVREE
jgi:hypothetical protein